DVLGLPGADAVEPRRRDAYDYERNIVHGRALADRQRRAPEPALREPVADHRDWRRALPVVLHADQAAGRRRHTQRREESARDIHAADRAALSADERSQPICDVEFDD